MTEITETRAYIGGRVYTGELTPKMRMMLAQTKMDNLAAEIRSLGEKPDLTDGEAERLERQIAAHDKATAEYREIRKAALSELMGGPDIKVESEQEDRRLYGPKTTGDPARDDAMRTLDTLTRSQRLPAYAAERVERLLGDEIERSVTARWTTVAGDPAYERAFAKLLKDPQRGHMLWDEQERHAYQQAQQLRTAMSLSADHGAEMVPLTLDPAIMLTNDGSINPLRQLARVTQTATNAWTGVTSAGATAEWKTEAAQAADGSPDVADTSIPVFFGDVNVTYSYEVGMDALNFLAEVQRVVLDAADNLMATAYTTGNGSSAPGGIVTGLIGGSSEINTTGSEALDDSDPFALQNVLPARFSPNAVFMSHIAIANGYRQMETTNGALQFPELRQTPPYLLGKRWYENSNMDGAINPAATANNYVLIYGDIRQCFTIVDRIGSTIEILPGYGANNRPTGQRHMFLTFRTGSKVVVPQAARILDVPTTA